MRILDFVSVMIENKRVDKMVHDSDIIFGHQQVLDFLVVHKQHIIPEEVIKIFILKRRFRLSLQYMQIS